MVLSQPNHRPETSGLLLMIFLVHLILSSWGMQSIFNAPTSYLYTNTIFLLSLMMAIHSNAMLESIALALFINFTLLNLEIVTFTIYWPRVPWQGDYLGFAITNSTLRPFSCFLLYRIYVDLDENELGLAGFLYNSLRYTVSITLRSFAPHLAAAATSNRYRGHYENLDTTGNPASAPRQQQPEQHRRPQPLSSQVQFNLSQDDITITTEYAGGGRGGNETDVLF